MASLKVTVTYGSRIGYNENMFVSYTCPRFDCKINVSLFDLHGPSVVSSIYNYIIQVCLYGPIVIRQMQVF